MNEKESSWVKSLRTELWHLRTGGISAWRRHRSRRRVPGARVAGSVKRAGPEPEPEFAPWELPDRQPRRSLRVGVILDEFSALAFRWEWQQVTLTPGNWRDRVEQPRLDLLFVESAWNGNDGAWQYGLTGSRAPIAPLQDLVSWCRDHGVPTVFWNKEDPAHFEDFLDTARLFDWVLTTDADMVPAYRERLGHEQVAAMPFAAASWVHNPIRTGIGEPRDVAFAGMYYRHRFPARREQMDLLLGAAAAVSPRMETGLEIFSRFHGGDDRYQFPAAFEDRVKGSLTYAQTLTAYRQYRVFLNVSSIPESTTMCPRRVFEVSACATPVVSTPTRAITNIFSPAEMVTVSEPEQAQWSLRALIGNDEWRDRMAHKAARRVLTEHTYRHRIDTVLERVGLPDQVAADPSVTVIVSTNRPQQLDHVLASVGQQAGLDLQLVLVTHGFEAAEEVGHRAADLGVHHVVALSAQRDQSLGACLNLAVKAADGEVVAKFDDDDLYGPQYLGDQLRALEFSGADVVGKRAHHVLIEDLGALVLRFPEHEHRFTDLVMGPTLIMQRQLAADLRFADRTQGEDTDFLRRLLLDGGRIYSSDRFGFVQVRRAAGHTWEASAAELLATGRIVAYGAGTEHVFA